MNVLAVYMVKSVLYDLINSFLDEETESFSDSQQYLDPNKNISNVTSEGSAVSGYLFIEGAEPRIRDNYYLTLREDYSSRPNIIDMDWANCSWADPDDSLFPNQ